MNSEQPLHTQLYDAMFQRIRSGAWRTGDRVPSEKSLVAEFGTSRGPVRQALNALRAEGMIGGARGGPARVQRPVPSQSLGRLLSFTEWAIGAGFTPGRRVVEAARRPATEEVALQLGVRAEEPIVEIVRLRTLDGAPALLQRSVFPHEVGLGLLAADLNTGSIYRHLAERHLVPVKARHVIDAVAAHALDAEWLRVAPGSPLLRARRVSYDECGAIVECADDRYLPSMTTFVIENAVERHDTSRVRKSLSAAATTQQLA